MIHRRLALALSLWPALAPTTASAHPHVFVDTEMALVFDAAGTLAGVRLTWVYDDFFSFLITAELGLDPDGDMVLTPAEETALADFVLDWPAEFGGDLHVAQGGVPIALGDRTAASVAFDGGRIRETHLRLLAQPVPMLRPVTVQVFDPYYYTAYDLSAQIGLSGRSDCAVDLQRADLNAAYSLVDELLYGRPAADVGPDEQFPEVGDAFADTVTLTCPG